MTDEAERQGLLEAVLLEYVEAVQAGGAPDRERLLAAHPELRADLQAFLDGYDEMTRLAGPLRTPSPPPEPPAEIGRLGDFRLLREAGRGGMGIVYEAEQISLRRRVALKVLPFAAAIDPRQLRRFENEAMAAAHLRHENVVPVFAVGCERGVHYYAMQFIDGQSLAALLDEMRHLRDGATTERSAPTVPLHPSSAPGDGRRYFDWVARLGKQAGLGLEHAHQMGIVHRDVKPANLLLDSRGQLWVTDFGLAQVSGDVGVTRTGEVLGTLRYASPEQARARRGVVDQRSDVYSLGATLYELLTLRPAFDGADRIELLRQIADDDPPPPRRVAPSVPAELETIVLAAIRKEPSERYASAQELADDLQRFLDNRPVLAKRPGPADHLRKWARRHPSLVAAGCLVLLLLSAGSLLSAALIRAEQGRTRAEQQKAEAAYQRERQRAEEAETRLRLAQRSVAELIEVSEEELADRPGMEGVRKRLLRSALAYYQEIIELRRDDPDAQAELRDVARRVEKILADLAVLRAATKLYLLCQPIVLDDLGLDDRQRPLMKELTARVGKEWVDSFDEVGRVPRAERWRRMIERGRANEAAVNAILSPAQQARLREIGWQAEGPAAFRDPEVVAALGLTAEQRERIRAIEDEALDAWMRWRGPGPPPKAPDASARSLEVLTEAQARRWREMSGEPVKGQLAPFGAPTPPPGK